MFVRRRPLLGAAMIGGTAFLAGRAGQRSAQREASQDERIDSLETQAPAPATAPAGPPDIATQLQTLQHMADQGVLTPEQFEAAKQKVLGT